MDRRQTSRVTACSPVRIWGMDAHSLPFMAVVTLKNMSENGAHIQGVRRQLKMGEVLELQVGEEKAQFRVAWVGRLGTAKEGEIGLERLPDEPYIWDVDLGLCSQFAGIS